MLGWVTSGQAQRVSLTITNAYGIPSLSREQIQSVSVTTNVISDQFGYVYAMEIGDLDNDGKADVVAAGYQSDKVVCWLKKPIGWVLQTIGTGVNGASGVSLADIDHDGKVDVVGSADEGGQIYWWRNASGDGTSWTPYIVDGSVTKAYAVDTGDMNGDGRADIVAASYSGNAIYYWQNIDGSGTNWERRTVATGFSGPTDVKCADMDSDGDLDIVACANSVGTVSWWENTEGTGEKWVVHVISPRTDDAFTLDVQDANGDGQPDIILGTSGGLIIYWENLNAGISWRQTAVAQAFTDIKDIAWADMDEDGDLDVVACSFDKNEIAWWEQRIDTWQKWSICANWPAPRALACGDLDQDGRSDVAAGTYSTDTSVRWFGEDPEYAMTPFAPVAGLITTNYLPQGRMAAVTVTNSTVVDDMFRYLCYGWQGSGSFPSGSSTNTGAQTVSMDSSVTWLWKPQYRLEVSADKHGLVDGTSGWYDDGEKVTLTATAVTEGYIFYRWFGVTENMATNNPLVLTMDQPYEVEAQFAMNWYEVTASAGLNGSIVPSGTVQVVSGGNQTFRFYPDAGYEVSEVKVNDESKGAGNEFTFANIDSNYTLQVYFSRKTIGIRSTSSYGNTVPPSGRTTMLPGGTQMTCRVSDSPVIVGGTTQFVCNGWTGTGSVPGYGTSDTTASFVLSEYSTIAWSWKTQVLFSATNDVGGRTDKTEEWVDRGGETQVSAIPDQGYVFSGWSGNMAVSAQMDNPLTLLMDRKRDVTAHFDVFRPVIEAGSGNNGRIEPSGRIDTAYLSQPTFEIIPDEGYRIASVTVDGVSVGVQPVYQFEPVAADHTIYAVFSDDAYVLTVASAYGTASPEAGTHSFSASDIIQCKQNQSIVTSGASTQFLCTGWTGSGSVSASGTNMETSLFILKKDSAITWNWSTQYWFSVDAAAGGTVDASNQWVDAESISRITATADPGYSFAGWQLSITGLDTNTNPLDIPFHQAVTATAHFEEQRVTLTATSAGMGQIVPSGSIRADYGTNVAFVITPNTGYRVEDVTVDDLSIGATTGYTFTNVMTNHTIHASFTLDFYTLSVTNAGNYGQPVPQAGSRTVAGGLTTNGLMLNSVVERGSTQLVCAGWTGAGSAPTNGTGTNTGSFIVRSDSSVNWLWNTNVQLAVSAGPNGAVSTTGGWYPVGTTGVTVQAVPDGYFRFAGWSGDVPASQSNANPLVLSMTQPRAITAQFSTNTIYVSTSKSGSGDITPASQFYPPNSDVTIRVVPWSGSRIQQIMLDSVSQRLTNYYDMSLVLSNLVNDHTVTATFGDDEYALYVQSAYGVVDPAAGTNMYAKGTSVHLSLERSPQLIGDGRSRAVYTEFSGTGSVPATGTESNLSITVTSDSSITWNWKTQHVLQVSSTIGGRVSGESNAWHDVGDSVSLVAAPDIGYRFITWSGDVPSSVAASNIIELTMDQGRTVEAVFADAFAELVVSSPYGQTDPAEGTHSYVYGSNVTCGQLYASWPTNPAGTQFVCQGWAGTGDVPASGTTLQTDTFSLQDDSSIAWLWITNVELSLTQTDGGTIATDAAWVRQGSNAVITATPGTGMSLSRWIGDVPAASSNQNPLYVIMDRSRSVEALFVTNQPILSISSKYGTPVPAAGSEAGDYGRVENCSVSPTIVSLSSSERMICTGWSGTGDVESSGSNVTTSVMITQDSSLTWNWKKQYVLEASGGLNGWVSPTSTWFDVDASAQCLATANSGYQFDYWSGDVAVTDTTNNPVTVTMDAARTLRANFIEVRPILVVSNSIGGCSPAPGTHTEYDYGDEIGLLIYQTPYPSNALSTHYVCTGWNGSGSVPSSGSGSYTNIILQEASLISWNWKTQFMLTVTSSVYGSVASVSGWKDQNAEVDVTAMPDTGQVFAGWSGDLSSPSSSNENPMTVTMDQSRRIEARFTTNRPVLTIISDLGEAIPAVGIYSTNYHAEIFASVTCGVITNGPGTQYLQQGWSGSGSIPPSGDTCHLSATITNDSTLVWNWQVQYALTVTNEAGGTVDAPSGWHNMGTNVSIRAVPDAHFRFDSWQGNGIPDALTNRAELSVAMSEPISLTALFSTNNLLITATVEGTDCGSMSPTGTIVVAPHGELAFDLATKNHCEGYLVVDGRYVAFTNRYVFSDVIEDHSIRAVFEKENVLLYVGSTYPDGRTVPPIGAITYKYGDSVTCMVTNSPYDDGVTLFTCNGWTGAGNVPLYTNGMDPAVVPTFTMEEDSQIIWQWDTNYWLEIVPSPFGSVDVDSGWKANELITLNATVSNHASFVGWAGDTENAVTNGTELVFMMEHARTIEPVFAPDKYIVTIESAHGNVDPEPGSQAYDYGTRVVSQLTSNPVFVGEFATQYTCSGWSLMSTNGLTWTNGTSTQAVYVVTNSATIRWNWETKYYLDLSMQGEGKLVDRYARSMTSQWMAVSNMVFLEAVPDTYSSFNSWTGTMNTSESLIFFYMTKSYQLTALFDTKKTTQGVPYWWMAQYGWTDQFDINAGLDQDGDGFFTWQEWIAFTVPTNAASYLSVDSFNSSGTNRTLSWCAQTNRVYRIDAITNLLSTNWIYLATQLTFPDTNGTYQITGDWLTRPEAIFLLQVEEP